MFVRLLRPTLGPNGAAEAHLALDCSSRLPRVTPPSRPQEEGARGYEPSQKSK
jgi:hypothetical protein